MHYAVLKSNYIFCIRIKIPIFYLKSSVYYYYMYEFVYILMHKLCVFVVYNYGFLYEFSFDFIQWQLCSLSLSFSLSKSSNGFHFLNSFSSFIYVYFALYLKIFRIKCCSFSCKFAIQKINSHEIGFKYKMFSSNFAVHTNKCVGCLF